MIDSSEFIKNNQSYAFRNYLIALVYQRNMFDNNIAFILDVFK